MIIVLLIILSVSVLASKNRFVPIQFNDEGLDFLKNHEIFYFDASGKLDSSNRWIHQMHAPTDGIVVNKHYESVLVKDKLTNEVGFILDERGTIINPQLANVKSENFQVFAIKYNGGKLHNEPQDLSKSHWDFSKFDVDRKKILEMTQENHPSIITSRGPGGSFNELQQVAEPKDTPKETIPQITTEVTLANEAKIATPESTTKVNKLNSKVKMATIKGANYERFVPIQSRMYGIEFLQKKNIFFLLSSKKQISLNDWIHGNYQPTDGVIVNAWHESVLVKNKLNDEVGFILNGDDKIMNPLKSSINDGNLQVYSIKYKGDKVQNELEDLVKAKLEFKSDPSKYNFEPSKLTGTSTQESSTIGTHEKDTKRSQVTETDTTKLSPQGQTPGDQSQDSGHRGFVLLSELQQHISGSSEYKLRDEHGKLITLEQLTKEGISLRDDGTAEKNGQIVQNRKYWLVDEHGNSLLLKGKESTTYAGKQGIWLKDGRIINPRAVSDKSDLGELKDFQVVGRKLQQGQFVEHLGAVRQKPLLSFGKNRYNFGPNNRPVMQEDLALFRPTTLAVGGGLLLGAAATGLAAYGVVESTKALNAAENANTPPVSGAAAPDSKLNIPGQSSAAASSSGLQSDRSASPISSTGPSPF